MSAAGSSLLEVVAAVALASLFAAAASDQARSALAVLADVRMRDRALTSARNLLEAEIGTPCAAIGRVADCPADLTCERVATVVTTLASAPGTLVRITARVAARSSPGVELAALSLIVRRPAACG